MNWIDAKTLNEDALRRPGPWSADAATDDREADTPDRGPDGPESEPDYSLLAAWRNLLLP